MFPKNYFLAGFIVQGEEKVLKVALRVLLILFYSLRL